MRGRSGRFPRALRALALAWMIATLAACGADASRRAASPDARRAIVPAPTPKPGPTPEPDRSVLPPDAPEDADIATDIEPGIPGGRLVISISGDPKHFNPVTVDSVSDQFIRGLQFSGLIGYDTFRQQTTPGLAKSWSYDPATYTWTFHLRRGLKWSDGAPLTADDFLFYTQVIFDPAIPNDEHLYLRLDGKPYEFAAPDPYTFTARIPGVDSFAFENLGLIIALPRHALEAHWKAGRLAEVWGLTVNPAELVVSGPFKLREVRPGQSVVLERNPHYYRFDAAGKRLPYVDELVMLVVSNREAEEVRFLAGDIDLLDQASIQPSNLARFQDEAERGNFTIYELGPSLNVNHYYFNLHRGGTYLDENGERKQWLPAGPDDDSSRTLRDFRPFVDPIKRAWFEQREFRIACSEATDRQAMIDTVLFGLGQPNYGLISPSNREWYNPDIPTFPYNPDSAKRRLEALGMIDRDGDGIREDAQGNPIRFTIVTNRESNIREKVAQLLRQNLRDVGLDARVDVLQFNNLITKLSVNYDFECVLIGIGTGIPPHPAMSAGTWLSSGRVHGWYPEQKSPMTPWEAELDRLYGQMKQVFDRAEQKKILDRMQVIFCEQQPMIHTFTTIEYVAARNTVGNLKPTIMRSSLTSNLDELFIRR